MKREIEAPAKPLLTTKEAIAWLESQGIDANDAFLKEMAKASYLFGVRKRNRQQVLYHWKGLVSLLWRVELGDFEGAELGSKSGETGEN